MRMHPYEHVSAVNVQWCGWQGRQTTPWLYTGGRTQGERERRQASRRCGCKISQWGRRAIFHMARHKETPCAKQYTLSEKLKVPARITILPEEKSIPFLLQLWKAAFVRRKCTSSEATAQIWGGHILKADLNRRNRWTNQLLLVKFFHSSSFTDHTIQFNLSFSFALERWHLTTGIKCNKQVPLLFFNVGR